MTATHARRVWNPRIGDRVRYRDSRLFATGTVVEELTRESVVVHWDGMEYSSVHDGSMLQPALTSPQPQS